MTTTFIDTTNISLIARIDQGSLCITCQGSPLPTNDMAIDCLIGPDAQVSFTFAFIDEAGTLTVSHVDAAGNLQVWAGTNPRAHDFMVTGGDVTVMAVCCAPGASQTAIIPIKVRPKTTKPYEG